LIKGEGSIYGKTKGGDCPPLALGGHRRPRLYRSVECSAFVRWGKGWSQHGADVCGGPDRKRDPGMLCRRCRRLRPPSPAPLGSAR